MSKFSLGDKLIIRLYDPPDEYGVVPYSEIEITVHKIVTMGGTYAIDNRMRTYAHDRGKWRDSSGNLWEVYNK